jgi:MoaA/NifB/PqqE/SkfB family radical SAM enzyme
LDGGGVVPQIHIAGGEPLIHPKLDEIIVITRRYFPDAKMKIVTNGLLLLKQSEDFWECCRKNKVDIIISHYPINLDIKSIRKKAKNYKIKIRYYRGVLPWFKMSLDLTGGYDVEKNFQKCTAALQCVELRDGKIATCQYILKMTYFKEYFKKDIDISEKDFIDIYKAKNIDEILEFISRPVPFCRYCTLKYSPVEWGQSKKDISEWT